MFLYLISTFNLVLQLCELEANCQLSKAHWDWMLILLCWLPPFCLFSVRWVVSEEKDFSVVLSVVKQHRMFMLVDRSHAALSQALLTAPRQVSWFMMHLHGRRGAEGCKGSETSSAEVPLSLTLVLANVSDSESKISVLSYCTVIRSSFCDMPSFRLCWVRSIFEGLDQCSEESFLRKHE